MERGGCACFSRHTSCTRVEFSSSDICVRRASVRVKVGKMGAINMGLHLLCLPSHLVRLGDVPQCCLVRILPCLLKLLLQLRDAPGRV